MNKIPQRVLDLVREREQARAAKDFGRSDALREEIARAGFDVIDTPEGSRVVPGRTPKEQPETYPSSAAVPSILDRPPTVDATVQWLVEGWPEDILRGIESFRRNSGDWSTQHVVVDLTEGTEWPGSVEVVRVRAGLGWAAGRNAGLRRSAGRVVVLVDGSVEAEGDVLGPLTGSLADPRVGVTGPFGLVTDDLHEFRDSPGPDVDAVGGYLMALRRELVERGLRFDEKFKFYRIADVDLSFQVKAMGLRATVTPLPVTRHEHRMWAATPEPERDRLSKRNFYRYLDRWRGRTDLLVSRPD